MEAHISERSFDTRGLPSIQAGAQLWQRAYPDAVAWASPGVRERARARHIDVHFDRDLEAAPPEEWCAELDQTLVPGGIFKEFVFFHKASATLILADTIMNLELDKLDEPWRTATKLSGMYYPHGQIFFGMRVPLLLQRSKAKAALGRVSWRPRSRLSDCVLMIAHRIAGRGEGGASFPSLRSSRNCAYASRFWG